MGIGNILALSQVTGYVLNIILFFIIVWPMSKNLRGFNGMCILFSSGTYDDQRPDHPFEVTFWAPGISCAFVIFLSFISLFISLWQTIRISIHLVKNTDSSFIGVFLTCVTNFLVCILFLGTAPAVTAGFKIWCASIETDHSFQCSTAGIAAKWKDDTLHPQGFYIQIGAVQFGLYMSFLTWLVENLFSGYKLLVYHRQEHVFRSLSRERQRLLGDYDPDFY